MRVLLINLLIVILFVWSGEMQGEVAQDQQSDNIVCGEEYGMILFAIKIHADFEKSRIIILALTLVYGIESQ